MIQNRLLKFFSFFILSINANLSFAIDNPNINVIGLFKNKVIIVDGDNPRKVLKVGEISSIGLKLVAATSRGATFQDAEGNLINIGLNNTITTSFNNQDNQSKQSTTNGSESTTNGSEFIILNESNQYIANILINNKQPPIKSIVDTGASLVTINSSIANYLGIDYINTGTKTNVSTASDRINGYTVTLHSVQLGTIKLMNVNAIVLDGDQPEMALIGMSFLKHLNLQYSGNKLELTVRKN